MTTSTDAAPAGPRAAGVHWDLSPLVADGDEARRRLDAGLERARAFETRYRGALAAIDAPALAEALEELSAIDNELSRVSSYVNLRESVDVTSQENKDLSAAVDRALVEAANALRFFDLEWIALDEDRARELYDAPEVARDRHYLVALRRFAPHTLSEPEERMLAERGPAAVGAWQTLFGRITSTLEVPFDAGDGPEPHTIDRLLAHVRDPDRELRRRALETLYEALAPHADTLAHSYDTLVGDRLAMDRLRHYSSPMEPTHLRNELPGEVVDRMLDAVERHYPIAHRWFRVKAGILGVERLELHDQYAPVGEFRPVDYPEALRLIDESFGRFSPRVAGIAGGFFDERRVDAEPRAGKRGGAFCAPVAQDASPYILMNFTDRMNDVMTLAHELGHGMHFTLASEEQTALSAGTGIALAEVPSTFAELLAFDHLMAVETRSGDPPGAGRRARGGVVRHGLPPDRPHPLRAAGLRAARRGEHAHPRAPLRGLVRGEREVLRRRAPAAGGLPAGVVVHPPLHLDALLHLRLRLRAPRHAGALRALPRARGRLRRRLPRVPGGGRVDGPGRAPGGAGRGPRRPRRVGAGVRGDGADGRGGRGRLRPRRAR